MKPSRAQNSIKSCGADSHIKMLRFSDVSSTNSITIFRVFWWFGRTKTDHWVLVLPNHKHTLKVGDGVSYRNVGKPSHLDAFVYLLTYSMVQSPS